MALGTGEVGRFICIAKYVHQRKRQRSHRIGVVGSSPSVITTAHIQPVPAVAVATPKNSNFIYPVMIIFKKKNITKILKDKK